jgi:hypothetical protein
LASARDPFELSEIERSFIERALHDSELSPPLVCVGCGASSRNGDGWQAHLTDDERPEIEIYCPDCAERELGD